jgi:6-phosphogluconolactonase (cycloisomerase 2 family)
VILNSGGAANNSTALVTGQTVTTTACTVTATEGALTGTSAVSVIPGTATFGYLANSGNSQGTISQFSVAAATAPYLTALSPATVNATQPQQVIIDPNGLYAYSFDTSAKVHIYDIAPSGSTTPAAGTLTLRANDPTVTAGTVGPNVGVIDPTGRFLYVTDGAGSTLNGFNISQVDGTLTPITGVVNFTTNINGPSDVLTDRTGAFLFIVNSGNATVSSYTIAANGAVTAVSSLASGTQPFFATVDSANLAGQILVVPGGDTTVSTYTINATTGALAQVGSAVTISGATALDNAVVDPTGSYLYLADFGSGSAAGQVLAYNISAAGVIGAQIGTALPTDVAPGGMALDPTGTLLVIDTNGVDNTSPSPIDLYSVGTGGALTADTSVPGGVAPFGFTFLVANQ